MASPLAPEAKSIHFLRTRSIDDVGTHHQRSFENKRSESVMSLKSCISISLAIAALIGVGGCSEGLKTIPVYGTVTFVDRPAPPTCDLIFQPLKVDGPLRPSFADREANGSYRVKAFKNSKGLIPGTYHVQLVFHDLKPGADPKLETSWKLTNYDGGDVQVDANSSGIEYNIEVRKKT
jgi:hypothetical protein